MVSGGRTGADTGAEWPRWREREPAEPTRIMVVGGGDLGVRVLHGLADSSAPRSLCLLGRDPDAVPRAVNLARLAALQRGFTPAVVSAVTDLGDLARTAEKIAGFDPDIIFAAVSRQPWHVITTLPAGPRARLAAAGFGPWLPMHLDPVLKLMRAVRAAGAAAIVVNAAFPDAVHPALRPAGLSPHTGIGNVANPVPALRLIAAERLGCPVAEVRVRFVAHHYVSHRVARAGDSGGAPLSLTFWRGGQDVTARVDVDSALRTLAERYRRPGGRAGQAMTAASALSVIEPLAAGVRAAVHAPGPGGLPGGYPVLVEGHTVRLDLPPGLDRDRAREINEAGQRHDGIDRVDERGRVWFAAAAVDVMKNELGYSCASLDWTDVEGYADELADRYVDFTNRLGV